MKKLLSFSFLSLILNLSAQKNLEKSADSIMKAHHIPEMAYAVITPDKTLVQKQLAITELNRFMKNQTLTLVIFFI